MGNLKTYDEETELRLLNKLSVCFGNEIFTPGLHRTLEIFKPLILEFKRKGTRAIIIGGTNGKGQTAHTLTYFLHSQGRTVALWTSPHILSLRERFVFGHGGIGDVPREIDYTELEKSVDETYVFLNKNHPGVYVSYYEFLFLVFLKLAVKKDYQYLILEVGLGGRFDTVNHFDAECSCLTSISRDHQTILGSRYSQILYEKLGITRPGKTLFTHFHLNYLNALTKDYTLLHQIPWAPIKSEKNDYYTQNILSAYTLYQHLEKDFSTPIEKLLKGLPLFKGRREIMTFKGKSLIFIGAHNIDGMRVMLEGIKDFPDCIMVSFSDRPLNEVQVMLKSLERFFQNKSDVVLTAFQHPKAMEMQKLNDLFEEIKDKGIVRFASDWKTELNESKKNTFLVCGSYYFIGEVQKFIASISRA